MKTTNSKTSGHLAERTDKRIHNRTEKEQALVRAALHLFAQKGFDAATTKEIARQASCSEGLLFSYFGSKEGLLLKCLEEGQEAFLSEWQALWQQSGTLEETLTQSLGWLGQHYLKNQKLIKISTLRSLLDPKVATVKHSLLLDPRFQITKDALMRLNHQHLIRSDVNIPAFVNLFFSTAYGIGFLGPSVYGMTQTEVEESLVEAARILARGLTNS